jgi:DNA-binding NarL/FixJ family response regulator
MKVIRVVIGDDDAGVRSALSEVLQADARFSVVGTAATGAELVEMGKALDPDVVLLDVRMPGGGPVAALALTAQSDGLPRRTGGVVVPVVIAVSAQTSAATVLEMLRAGAVGYLAKGSLGTLPDLVARCVGGEVVLAVPSAAHALRQLVRSAAQSLE